jgi:organic radical activating enzyme
VTASQKGIDTSASATGFRALTVDATNQRLLISRLSGSAQEPDITKPINCDGFGRLRHFRLETAKGWPANPLPIVPACRALRIEEPLSVMRAQVFQLAACPWRCWYCFVPYSHLRADPRVSKWMTCDEMVAAYANLPERPQIIDLSGGSPDLAPEWPIWMMQALRKQGLEDEVYLWSDDNLSTSYLLDCLSQKELDLLRGYRNYGRVCCFKGFNEASFVFNTRARSEDYERQFQIARETIRLGIDVYGYVTLTSPSSSGLSSAICEFFDRLQDIAPTLPLRIVPLQIQVFSSMESRVRTLQLRSMEIQEEVIWHWSSEMSARFDSNQIKAAIGSFPLAA